QKFLTNPEDVYPSILVIPSVFVDKSGVVISKDFAEGRNDRMNIAFSQGAGGAVDGQSTESWILGSYRTNILLSPARDHLLKYLPKEGGGSQEGSAVLGQRLVTEQNIDKIWKVISTVYDKMPSYGMEGPYDIE